MARTRSDALWARVDPLIPARPATVKEDDLPTTIGRWWGPSSTWCGAASLGTRCPTNWVHPARSTTVFARGKGESGERESLDSFTVKAPLARAAVGPAPTDRGKQGTKRSVITERRGLPVALAIEGANRYDRKLTGPRLKSLTALRPAPEQPSPQHLWLDAGYDDDEVRDLHAQKGDVSPIRPNQTNRERHALAQGVPLPARADEPTNGFERRGAFEVSTAFEATKEPRRWVVERFVCWLNGFRRLLIRWEKRADPSLAFLPLASALMCFQHGDHLLVSGYGCRAYLKTCLKQLQSRANFGFLKTLFVVASTRRARQTAGSVGPRWRGKPC